MTKTVAIEAVSLYFPLCSAFVLALLLRPSSVVWSSILMSVTWQLASLPWLNYFCVHAGVWQFTSDFPQLLTLPVALYLGWVVLWGVCPVLVYCYFYQVKKLSSCVSYCVSIIIFILIDVIFMPLLSPVL